MLASGVAVASPTSNTTRRVVGQWGGAGGAVCEDHLAVCGELFGFARRLEKPEFFSSQTCDANALQTVIKSNELCTSI